MNLPLATGTCAVVHAHQATLVGCERRVPKTEEMSVKLHQPAQSRSNGVRVLVTVKPLPGHAGLYYGYQVDPAKAYLAALLLLTGGHRR